MREFTLRQLKYFITTVECGSVAGAARKLFIAPPSITNAIKNLEETFNVQLFIRTRSHGMTLTPAGKRFHQRAQELMRVSREFEQNALAENELTAGRISIGCFATFAPLHIPRIIAAFSGKYPGVEVQVRDGHQAELTQGLESGRFDCVILYDIELGPNIEKEWISEPQKPYLLVPENHRFARQESVSLHDIYMEPFILLDVSPSRNYFLGLFEKHNLQPRTYLSSPSIEMVRGMVGQGLGYSILVTKPASPLTYDNKPVVALEIEEEVEPSIIVAAWLNVSHLSKPVKLFLEECREAFAQWT